MGTPSVPSSSVVTPDPDHLPVWAKQQGISGDLAAICKDKKTNNAILADMTKLGKAAELKGFEMPRAVHIEPEPFSVDNGMLTPTFKLKRNVARDHFRAVIDKLYDSIPGAEVAKQAKL